MSKNKTMRRRRDLNDIVDRKFGKLKVLSYDHSTGGTKHYFYKCRCDCGNIIIKERSSILKSINLQCIDCYFKAKSEKIINDMKDKRFGRLVVIDIDRIEPYKDKNGDTDNKYYFKCKCDCDNICIAEKRMLVGGGKRSCGCLHDESASIVNTTHGFTKTRFYRIWADMVNRCTNPNNKRYYQYGGRSISVCDRWRYSFENFKEDMYESYLEHAEEYGESDTTIERIDVNGNYELSNCTWKTKAEQNRNMTNSYKLIYHGQEYIALDLQRMFFPYSNNNNILYSRLHNEGYKSGDTINPDTCYDYLFKGTHIQRPVEFVESEINNIVISPIEFISFDDE